MKTLITGLDADGRSCVVEEIDVTPAPIEGGMPGMEYAMLYATSQSPPPARPAGLGHVVDNRLAPGFIRSLVIDREPDEELSSLGMHCTDTLDFIVIQDGTIDLILDAGTYPLDRGDLVVMTGVDHAWRAGAKGCRQLLIAIGTPATPPASPAD